jgi:hypothetical protein
VSARERATASVETKLLRGGDPAFDMSVVLGGKLTVPVGDANTLLCGLDHSAHLYRK